MKIKYIKQIVDTTLYDRNFREALSLNLAADLAYPLTQSITLAQLLTQKFEKHLAVTRSYDAQEGGMVRQVEASEWFDSRF